MPQPFKVGISTFRTLNGLLSGYMIVRGGSSHCRGVHRQSRPAKVTSLRSGAGSDDGWEPTDGQSAHTSAAHAAGQQPCADLAPTDGLDAGCASSMNESSHGKARRGKKSTGDGDGDGPTNYLAQQRAQIPGGDVLPEDGAGFVERVNDRIDLIRLTENVLRGEDDKNVKSLLGQLLTVCYKNARRPAPKKQDGPDKLTWNLPR